MLTVEYRIHNPAGSGKYDLLTHMNPMDQSTQNLLSTKLRESKSDKYPPWVPQLVNVTPGEDSSKLVFCINSIEHEPGAPFQYRNLDPDRPLVKALEGITFIEFPRIEVYSASHPPFEITGQRRLQLPEGPVLKRPRLETKERKPPLMQGLAQYWSDGEGSDHEPEPGSEKEIGNILNVIGGYSDISSDEEVEVEEEDVVSS